MLSDERYPVSRTGTARNRGRAMQLRARRGGLRGRPFRCSLRHSRAGDWVLRKEDFRLLGSLGLAELPFWTQAGWGRLGKLAKNSQTEEINLRQFGVYSLGIASKMVILAWRPNRTTCCWTATRKRSASPRE